MRLALLMTHIWPGFLQLWVRGRWQGLVPAFAFALLLNLGLVATFIWPELLSKHGLLAIWVSICCVWIVAIMRVRREIPRFLPHNSANESLPGLFIRAQAEYLRGNWFEAESLLRQLGDTEGDAEASLLLATLYRRTGRLDNAKRQLRTLAQIRKAGEWGFEIRREFELIQQAAHDPSNSADRNWHEHSKSGMPEAA